MTPFDFLNAINFTKENIVFDDQTKKEYVPFLVNRGLSYFPDTVFYANEMNRYPFVDKDMQFQFLLNTIVKKKRFSKWAKKESDSQQLQMIKDHYGYSSEKAQVVLDILTKEQLKMIEEQQFKGGR